MWRAQHHLVCVCLSGLDFLCRYMNTLRKLLNPLIGAHSARYRGMIPAVTNTFPLCVLIHSFIFYLLNTEMLAHSRRALRVVI